MSELEPWVEKTIHLLQSRTQESVEELRLMLEESIRQRYGNKRLARPIPGPSRKDDPKMPPKKKKVESQKTPAVPVRENVSSESSSNESDLAMEILEDDLACVVCREIAIAQHNRLVECAECHTVYHQECHNPVIPDSVGSDLRVVWYCGGCTKSKPKVNSPATTSGTSKASSKSSSSNSGSRSANKMSVGFTGKPFGGLSSSNKKSNNNAGSSSSKQPASSKSVSPNMNIINADKRLQIMKKKAAKKQEKRLNSK